MWDVMSLIVVLGYVRVLTFSQWVLVQFWSLGFVHHVGKFCEILGYHCSAIKDASLWEFLTQQQSITLEKTCTLRKSRSDSFGRMYCLNQSLIRAM